MAETTGYERIRGYNEIKGMLKRTVQRGKGFHAYIFSGEKGCGKETMANLFAMALQCEKQTGEPCMECASCKRALSGNQPDIIRVRHEKPESIGVEEIRTQLVDDMFIRPFENKYKIYLVPDASLMTVQAQNALLKTLEEPPAYGIMILLADNMEALLPTIRSRCNTVQFNPLPDKLVRDYLTGELQVSETYADIYTALSMGKIGIARQLAKSSEATEKLQESIRFLVRSKDLDSANRVEMTRKLAADKKDIYDYLDIYTIWFRDVLYFKATKESEALIFKANRSDIAKRASVSSYEGLQKILEAIDTARTRLRANVNPELVLELLFLTMSEG